MALLDAMFENDPECSEVQSGLFAEAAEDLKMITKRLEIGMMKSDVMMESVLREYDINIAQSELKCMEERGTRDDLMYLEEAAEEGALSKFKKMIDKLIQMWKDYISGIRNKVMSKICSSEARRTLNTVEKKIKMNPFVAKRKVEVMNPKKPLGVINSYRSDVDKLSARIIKGLGHEESATTLSKTKEKYKSELKRSIMGRAAMTMMTVSGIVAALNTEIDKLPEFVNACERANNTVLTKLKGSVSEDAAAAATAATQACMNFRMELAKEELNTHIEYVNSLMRAVKTSVTKAKNTLKGKTKITATVNESYDDFDYLAKDETIFEDGDDGLDLSDDDFVRSILGSN